MSRLTVPEHRTFVYLCTTSAIIVSTMAAAAVIRQLAVEVACTRALIGQRFQHYKGAHYRVTHAVWARDRWGEAFAVYEDDDGMSWARP